MARRGKTREQWARIVTAFEDSKQSLAKFCARRGISPRTLTWWRWQLRAPRPAPAGDVVRLLPVEVVDVARHREATREGVEAPGEPGARAADVEGIGAVVVAVGGIEVRVGVGTDVAYVTELVRSLRS